MYEDTIVACLRKAGIDPSPLLTNIEQTQISPTGSTEGADLPQESGIAAAALAEATSSSAAPAPDTQEPLPDKIVEAIVGPVTFPDGTNIKGGCQQLAQTAIDADPAEISRKQLSAVYTETVIQRLNADERLAAIEAEWARCMANSGFTGLSTSGSEISAIQDQVNKAAGDEVALRRAVEFDRSISKASVECVKANGNFDRRSALRLEYEKAFISDNREALEALILLTNERKASAGQPA